MPGDLYAGSNLPPPAKRFHELDSLRGAAALTVVFHHFVYLTSPGIQSPLLHWPLRVLIAGHQAVVLFFVLSGFVLTLPYLKNSRLRYGSFLVKRLCRIYLPYLAALALAVACDLLVPAYRSSSIPWINSTWSRPVTARLVLQHIMFIGSYNWEQFNTAFWSLVYEMRVSLVFPFVAAGVIRLRKPWSLAGALAASAALFLFTPIVVSASGFTQPDIARNLITLQVLAFFIAGSLLARHVDRVSAWFLSLKHLQKALLSVAVLFLYSPSHVLPMRIIPGYLDRYDGVTCAASLGLIVVAMNAPPLQRLLNHRLIRHLGTTSYSLYLVHGTVLFVLIHTCFSRVPLLVVLLLYLLCTWMVTEVFYYFVERPAMMLGRRLTSPPKIVSGARNRVPAALQVPESPPV